MLRRQSLIYVSMKLAFGSFLIIGSLSSGGVWEIDASHSAARFRVRHLMVSNVTGEFTGIKGTFTLNDKDLSTLKVESMIDASTLSTNNVKRDDHLKSPDFFDVGKHPTITFRSKKVSSQGSKLSKLVGDLTMHGVTKEVTLSVSEFTATVKGMKGEMRRGFSATTKLNRKDFGISYNAVLESGGVVIGEQVDVTVEMEVVASQKESANQS